MLYNYLVTALRNIRKDPLFSFINILSLAIGIASCIVIYLFIRDESGFDDFHSKKADIYRLDEVQTFSGTKPQKVALSMPGMGPAMQNDFPEVQSFTRFLTGGKRVYSLKEKKLLIERTVFVDSTFLEIFDFEILAGNRATALDEPYTVVMTEETALKFFESVEEAIGNTIHYDNNEVKITGILRNIPENSHLQFDALISMNTITREDPGFNDRWGSNFLNTYLLLVPDVDIEALEEKFDNFMIRHMEDEDITDAYKLFLQPLSEVHLASADIEHDYNNYRKFNGRYLDVFTVIGIIIIIIACVNFMNLTTARASHRWKEIGIRKTIGARKSQLFIQFVSESVLLAYFALIFGILLDLLFIPFLNKLIDRHLSLITLTETGSIILYILMITLLLGIIAGLYPSLHMTSYETSGTLKGDKNTGSRSLFRNALVVIQFGLAIAMIVSTLIVLQQLNYMKNKDIGFDIEHMLLIDLNREANDKFDILKNELEKNPYVLGVTASGQRIGNNFHQWGFKVKTDTGIYRMTPSNVFVDYDYLDVYGIKIKKGRGFSRDYSTDDGLAFVINEALAEELGLEDPVGTPAGHGFYPDDSLGSIIGVTENFNFNSLHHKVNTLSMVVHPDWGYDEMTVKIRGGNVEKAITEIQSVWEQHIDSWPFDYSFLDQHFENLYRSDKQMSSIVSIMAGLAILIACMGLFGLVALTTKMKVKEIGIRKVLGASIKDIIFSLSKQFIYLIIIAFIIAAPVTYFLLEDWLTNFAFRININAFVFLAGGAAALSISLATIGYHIVRSALSNPVDSLRNE